jgi:hypothetical protein
VSESLAVAGSIIEVVLPPDNVYAKAMADAAAASAALAQFYSGVTAAASRPIYPDYATGNAATSAGQFFFVAASGSYALYVHGTATALAPFPILDPATGRLIVAADASFGGATAPSNTAGYLGQAQVNGLYPCISLNGTVAGRKWSMGVSATGIWELWDNNAAATRLTVDTSGNILFGGDGTQDLGGPSRRGDTAFFQVGAINTCDGREKTPRRPLTAGEVRAAKRIAGIIGIFQYLREVELKGDAARHHCGPIAQEIWAIMADEGLIDPLQETVDPDCCYGLLGWDRWDAQPAVEEVRDEEGNLIVAARPAREAGERFNIREGQLAFFMIAGQEARLAALEAGL